MEEVKESEEFEKQRLDNSRIINRLVENAKAAIIGAIELHNKPIFSYRYEVCVILTINAWELAMKAYLIKNKPEIKMFDGEWSKEFLSCLANIVNDEGKEFLPQKESIEILYKYRCDSVHFYADGIELILYSLLRPNILHFAEFILKHFAIDLANDANLVILPIGFKRFVSPVDFLSKQSTEGSESVKQFINSIKVSAQNLEQNGFADGLLINYTMAVENVNRVKNADIVAGIVKEFSTSSIMVNKIINISAFTIDPNAPKVQIDETSLFTEKYTLNTEKLNKRLRVEIPDIKLGKEYNQIIKEIKEDINLFKWRYLDTTKPPTATSSKKGFYSEEGFQEIKRRILNLFEDEK